MKKISTLFKKDPTNLGRVIDQINEGNLWVYDDGVKATRKFDGTACAIINGALYKRYDAKKGKKAPDGAIPCQEPDEITGHHPHWVLCELGKPEDRYFLEALKYNLDNDIDISDGTYELCGPKIQGNPEKFENHTLVKHGEAEIHYDLYGDYSFNKLKEFLTKWDIEGIVFHHPDRRMCKIRKSDFGIKR